MTWAFLRTWLIGDDQMIRNERGLFIHMTNISFIKVNKKENIILLSLLKADIITMVVVFY
ncbi:hypothetical protein DL317_05700 [Limosilactobacillus reuteri]|nr:hypothetical protein A4V07_08585 [Limosilactobacillus reuteri]AXX74242.1 hypothetical protein DL317_05700 [Limosilactobacillus reuteri]OCW70201.1 hypothetical protein BBP14_11110 [Limosilactobacillus reuteri]OXE59963.1 hypothetical protein ADH69_05030 [Limosilactobacillus reuteri]